MTSPPDAADALFPERFWSHDVTGNELNIRESQAADGEQRAT